MIFSTHKSGFSFKALIREKIHSGKAADVFEMFGSKLLEKFVVLPN
jgi:hypothetical protein